LDGSVRLCAELAVIHNLKKWTLLRRRDETGAAQVILPDGDHLSAQALASGGGLKLGVRVCPVCRRQILERGIEKHGQDCGSPDIQMCGGNRTI
jgi:hypothetical protein